MAGESRSVVVRLSLDTAQAIRASREFGAEMDRSMSQAEKATHRSRGAIDQLGSTSGRIALVAAAGFAAIEVSAANFDEAMSHVAATGDDARSSIDALRQAAIQAGQDTAFSATEAAGGIENLAKAGLSAQDILGGGLKGSLDLAAAGGLDVASSAEIAATALTQFKLQGADVPHVADLLAAAAGKAQGDVSDMSMALKQSGLVASQMNLSIEETTGTLAAFASAGLLGSDAGTSFRTMLLRLANPTNEAADLMAQLGIQAYDAQGKFVGMASLAGQLQAALSDQTQAQRDAALATLFGSDAIRAASVLYSQGSTGIEDWTRKVDDSGYAAETASIRMDNLKGDIEQFTGSLETAFIGSGDGSQGMLRDLVQGATQMVNVFNSAPPAIQGTVTKLLAITAITAGAAWFGSKIIRGISDTRDALRDLGVTSTTTGRRLTSIAKTAAGVFAVGTAVGALADSIGRIDSENLDRSLEALQRGEMTDEINQVVDNLADIHSKLNAIDLGEAVTLFGAFGDTSLDKAADNIDQIDQKLANLVETGEQAQAAELFQAIIDQAVEAGVSADDAAEDFDKYALALRNVEPEAEAAAGATEDLAVKQRQAASRARELKNAMADQQDEARDTARAFVGLGDSLDDHKKSLKEWLHELEQQNEALRNFRINAETAAKKGLDDGLIASLQEAGPEGALRMRQLANATDAEIGRANKAWRSGQAEIRKYVDAVGEVPSKKVTRLEAKVSPALQALAAVKYALDQLRDKDITVTTNYLYKRGAMDAAGITRAGGGPIVGPGSKTSDSVPVMASSGEFMMSAAAVDHYGLDTMFRMNARRLAAGGSVNGTAWHGAGGTPLMPDVLDLSWLVGLDRLGERELHRRENIAEREERLAEKSLKQAQDRLDEERQALKDLRDARRDFMSDVTGNFRTDLGDIDLAQAGVNGALGSDFGNSVYAFAQQQMNENVANGGDPEAYNIADWVQQYLDTLSQDQLAALQAQASVGTLNQNAGSAEEFERVLEQLRAMGLRGGAYDQIAASGNLGQAQAYLQMGPEFIKELMQSFRREDRALQSLGQSVGNARFGADIRDQLKEVRQARRIAEDSRDELREIKQGQARMEKRLRRVEKAAAETGPDRTARGVGTVINHGSAAANRRPPR